MRSPRRARIGSPRAPASRGLLVAAEVAVALVLLVGAASADSQLRQRAVGRSGLRPAPRRHRRPWPCPARSIRPPSARRSSTRISSSGCGRFRAWWRSAPSISCRSRGSTSTAPSRSKGSPIPGAVVDMSYHGYPYAAGYRVATPGYLEALGVRLLQGRTLSDARSARDSHRRRWSIRHSCGDICRTRIRSVYDSDTAGMDPVNPTFTIVGVVADVHHASLFAPAHRRSSCARYQAPSRARRHHDRGRSGRRRPSSRRSRAGVRGCSAAVRARRRRRDVDRSIACSRIRLPIAGLR